jgi:tyrosine-protein kinase Etk/Wzc
MENQQQILLPEEEGIDIKKYIYLILSHWWWFGISVFISLTIAYLVNRYTQKMYSADCSVIVGEEKAGSGTIESMLDELTRVRANKRKAVVENEISILKSYKMARMAIEELDFGVSYVAVGRRGIAESQMYKSCPFIAEFDTSETNMVAYPIFVTILSAEKYQLTIDDKFEIDKEMRFGEKFEHKSFHFILRLRDPANFNFKEQDLRKFYFQLNDINSLAKQYRLALNVEVNDEKGAILTLSMHGYVSEQLADYLNKLSEVYLQANLDEKNQTSESTIRFIDEQLGGIVDSLESTGLRLQRFRTANKVIDLSKEGNFLYQKMQDLQSEKAIFDIKANYFAYLLDYISRRDAVGDVVAPGVVGVNDNLLNTLVTELNNLLAERRQVSFSVSENSPQIASIDNEVANAKSTLKENLQSLIESNRLELRNLEDRIAKIDREVQKLPGTEKQMIDIQRKFTINDQIYTFLLQKRAEAGITKASNSSDHKILDTARPENSIMVKPKVSMNYMMGLLAGGGIPLILLLLVEFFNSKISDRKFLEANLKAPIIGNIGHNIGTTELPVSEKPNSSLTESFRALRTNLQYILQEEKKGVIAVTSAVSGEGKTFCSVNLAGIIAMNGKKTLLINLDLRRPKIHRIFNLDNSTGMSTYLIGKTEFRDMVHETSISNLYVTTSGPVPPNPAELIGSERMRKFIAEAKKEYDYIIMDTPPVAIVTDTLALKDMLDALIFVVRHNYSDKQVVELANNLYEKHLIKSMGVTVNDIQLSGYYGYSYRYGYGYGYGYSYSYRASYYDEESEEQGLLSRIRKRLRM